MAFSSCADIYLRIKSRNEKSILAKANLLGLALLCGTSRDFVLLPLLAFVASLVSDAVAHVPTTFRGGEWRFGEERHVRASSSKSDTRT